MHCVDQPLFDFESNSTRELLYALETFQRVYAPVHGKICVVCAYSVCLQTSSIVLFLPDHPCATLHPLCDPKVTSFLLQYYDLLVDDFLNGSYVSFYYIAYFYSLAGCCDGFYEADDPQAAILNSQWQKAQLAKRICLAVLGVVVVLSIPTLMVHEIRVWPHDRWSPPKGDQCALLYPANYSELIYTFAVTKSAVSHGCMIFKTNLWLTGILFKVIPCLLLIVLSGSLMWKLRNAEKKRRSLLLNGGPGNDTNKSLNPDRTTAMLLAIVIVFLVTEFPQGVLAILNAIFTSDVHRYIYFNLGDLLDLMSLLNSSVNFILYCLMSSRYRNTFCSLILPISKCRCASSLGSAPLLMLQMQMPSGLGSPKCPIITVEFAISRCQSLAQEGGLVQCTMVCESLPPWPCCRRHLPTLLQR
uniref:G-protein coupled receptors family 1 profile domain-containing protein n=1 Tax=Ditylenchus dipsaci TaxID=166011 RepID=A0A915E2P0_9BILA